MAGTNAGFSASEFRDGIHFVMEMGAAVEPTDRATFHFAADSTYAGAGDDNDVPFSPAAAVTSTAPDAIRVPCAVKYYDDQGELTPFGQVAPTRVEVLLLDEEYALVAACTHVVVGGDTYWRRRQQPPVALFDVGVHVLHFTAESES